MTKFNPEGKASLTFGECLGPAMKITDPQDAAQYFADYVKFMQAVLDREPRKDAKTATDIAKANLGYYAGYYNDETRERVERLFSCQHPVFGGISEHGRPSAAMAMQHGAGLAGSPR